MIEAPSIDFFNHKDILTPNREYVNVLQRCSSHCQENQGYDAVLVAPVRPIVSSKGDAKLLSIGCGRQ